MKDRYVVMGLSLRIYTDMIIYVELNCVQLL